MEAARAREQRSLFAKRYKRLPRDSQHTSKRIAATPHPSTSPPDPFVLVRSPSLKVAPAINTAATITTRLTPRKTATAVAILTYSMTSSARASSVGGISRSQRSAWRSRARPGRLPPAGVFSFCDGTRQVRAARGWAADPIFAKLKPVPPLCTKRHDIAAFRARPNSVCVRD